MITSSETKMPPNNRLKPGPDPRKRSAFLAAFAELGIVTSACKAAGCSPRSVYRWRADPRFEEAFTEAKEEAIGNLEAEAMKRARDGIRQVKFYKGTPIMLRNPETGEMEVYAEHRYSDVLTMFLLKAAQPEKYRDNHVPKARTDVRTAPNEPRIDNRQMLPMPEVARAQILRAAEEIRAHEAEIPADIPTNPEIGRRAGNPNFIKDAK